jgi:2-polyprenyl-6-methoxyphenol hydroxylase-like FAD-dependent oxidoreductase
MHIAISGAGVAGPTLAYWLRRSGHEVSLIEQAPQLRAGGYVIDFWGLGYQLAERMGVLPEVLAAGYQVQEVRMVDRRGRRIAGFSAEAFRAAVDGRFTSLPRGELAAILFRRVADDVEVLFGARVEGLQSGPDGVILDLAGGARREVDLVVGCDGQHSAVRRLALGPEAQFEQPLGYYVAAFHAAGYRPRDDLTYLSYTTPGREIARFALRGDRTLFLMIFEAERLAGAEPADFAGRKAVLRQVFAGHGWETDRILDTLDAADDLYFDRMSQIHAPAWSAGRVALVGDAAFCPSLLAGEGAGLAMTAAYVLAGELEAAGADHATAFRRYEARLRPFIEGKQRSARRFAGYFAPRTRLGLWARNQAMRVLNVPRIGPALVARDLRDDFELPTYG